MRKPGLYYSNTNGEEVKMKPVKVAFFDTKPYDRKSFDEANQNFGFELTYFEARLNPASAKMAVSHFLSASLPK